MIPANVFANLLKGVPLTLRLAGERNPCLHKRRESPPALDHIGKHIGVLTYGNQNPLEFLITVNSDVRQRDVIPDVHNFIKEWKIDLLLF